MPTAAANTTATTSARRTVRARGTVTSSLSCELRRRNGSTHCCTSCNSGHGGSRQPSSSFSCRSRSGAASRIVAAGPGKRSTCARASDRSTSEAISRRGGSPARNRFSHSPILPITSSSRSASRLAVQKFSCAAARSLSLLSLLTSCRRCCRSDASLRYSRWALSISPSFVPALFTASFAARSGLVEFLRSRPTWSFLYWSSFSRAPAAVPLAPPAAARARCS